LTPGEELDVSDPVKKGVGAGPGVGIAYSLKTGLGSLVGELILLVLLEFPLFLLLVLTFGSFLLLLLRLLAGLLLFDAPCFF
jgi:hypothetical protein